MFQCFGALDWTNLKQSFWQVNIGFSGWKFECLVLALFQLPITRYFFAHHPIRTYADIQSLIGSSKVVRDENGRIVQKLPKMKMQPNVQWKLILTLKLMLESWYLIRSCARASFLNSSIAKKHNLTWYECNYWFFFRLFAPFPKKLTTEGAKWVNINCDAGVTMNKSEDPIGQNVTVIQSTCTR